MNVVVTYTATFLLFLHGKPNCGYTYFPLCFNNENGKWNRVRGRSGKICPPGGATPTTKCTAPWGIRPILLLTGTDNRLEAGRTKSPQGYASKAHTVGIAPCGSYRTEMRAARHVQFGNVHLAYPPKQQRGRYLGS